MVDTIKDVCQKIGDFWDRTGRDFSFLLSEQSAIYMIATISHCNLLGSTSRPYWTACTKMNSTMNKQIIKGHKMNIQYSKVLYKVITYIKLGFDKALLCVSTFFNTWNTSLISSRYCQLSLDAQIKSLQLKVSCNCHWLVYIFNLNSDTLPSRQKTQARNVLTWTCFKGHFLNIQLELHHHKLVVMIQGWV